jgi:hypothetical protein
MHRKYISNACKYVGHTQEIHREFIGTHSEYITDIRGVRGKYTGNTYVIYIYICIHICIYIYIHEIHQEFMKEFINTNKVGDGSIRFACQVHQVFSRFEQVLIRR